MARRTRARRATSGWACPQPIFRLADEERAPRAYVEDDFAVLHAASGDRHFVRGLIELPIPEEDGRFGYGSWIEVSKADVVALGELWTTRTAGGTTRSAGTLANELSPYFATEGLAGRFGCATFHLLPLVELEDADHGLVRAQQNGISAHRAHELAETVQPSQLARPARASTTRERAGVEARVVAAGEVRARAATRTRSRPSRSRRRAPAARAAREAAALVQESGSAPPVSGPATRSIGSVSPRQRRAPGRRPERRVVEAGEQLVGADRVVRPRRAARTAPARSSPRPLRAGRATRRGMTPQRRGRSAAGATTAAPRSRSVP